MEEIIEPTTSPTATTVAVDGLAAHGRAGEPASEFGYFLLDMSELIAQHPESLLTACLALCNDARFLELDYSPFVSYPSFGFNAVPFSTTSAAVAPSHAQLSTHRVRYRSAPWEPSPSATLVQLPRSEEPSAYIATAFPSQATRVARYLEQRRKLMALPATAEQLGLVLTDSSAAPPPLLLPRANPLIIPCVSVVVISYALVLSLATSTTTLGLPSSSYSFDRQPPRKGQTPPQLLALRLAVRASVEPFVAGFHLEHYVNRAAQRIASSDADSSSFCFTVGPFRPPGQADTTTIARRQFDVRLIRAALPPPPVSFELARNPSLLSLGPSSLKYSVLRPSSASANALLPVLPGV